MSALDELLKAVHDESFSQEMFELGEKPAAELAELRARLDEAEELLWEMTENPKFGLSSYGIRRINALRVNG
jgi:hypothetical protein